MVLVVLTPYDVKSAWNEEEDNFFHMYERKEIVEPLEVEQRGRAEKEDLKEKKRKLDHEMWRAQREEKTWIN